jgi:hypothetical protein
MKELAVEALGALHRLVSLRPHQRVELSVWHYRLRAVRPGRRGPHRSYSVQN